METRTLSNGISMPAEGFGVFQIPDAEQCRNALSEALKVGYRLFDTAAVYGNEEAVGEAIRESGVNRKDIFLTTKVWTSQMGYDRTLRAFRNSLDRLGTDYLDLYLIHMPYGDVAGTWRAMEKLYNEGAVRSIGVCNFSTSHLTDLCLYSTIHPMVNQIECHPLTQQKEMLEVARKLGIQIEAWAPFAEGHKEIFRNPILSEIAADNDKTVGQIILRWNVQRGIIVIPKSVHKERIEENFNIWNFSLSEDDMRKISALDTVSPLIFNYNSPDEVRRIYSIPCPE